MKKRKKNGWPRGPQQERTPRATVSPKIVVADNEEETSAASTEDSDDGGGDGTPAASSAAKIQLLPTKRIKAFLADDQGEAGDKKAQHLEEAQEESKEEINDKMVMGIHGQPAKQEFKTLELVPGRDGKFMFYKQVGCDETLEYGCAGRADKTRRNTRVCIQGFNNMFRTSPFSTEGFRGFVVPTPAVGGSPIPVLASPFEPDQDAGVKSRSATLGGGKTGVPGRIATLGGGKTGVPGWDPASEVYYHSDCTPSGLQECVGSGDRVGLRARADAGGKDDVDSGGTCAELRTGGAGDE